jgi:hypothetical protein
MNASMLIFFLTHARGGRTKARFGFFSYKLLMMKGSEVLGSIPSNVFMTTLTRHHLFLMTIDAAIVLVRINTPITMTPTIITPVRQTSCDPCTITPIRRAHAQNLFSHHSSYFNSIQSNPIFPNPLCIFMVRK